MVNTKHHICGDPGPSHQFEAKSSQFFLPHLTVWSYLQFAQMPTSRDLAIFVPMITTDGQTDYFTPGTHARRVTTLLFKLKIDFAEQLIMKTKTN